MEWLINNIDDIKNPTKVINMGGIGKSVKSRSVIVNSEKK